MRGRGKLSQKPRTGRRFRRNQRISESRVVSVAAIGIFVGAAALSYAGVRALWPAPAPVVAGESLAEAPSASASAAEAGEVTGVIASVAQRVFQGDAAMALRSGSGVESAHLQDPVAPITARIGPLERDSLQGKITRGSSLERALSDRGVPRRSVYQITTALRGVFDFRRSRPGDLFALITSPEGEIRSFEYRHGRESIYRLERTEQGGLEASELEVPTEVQTVVLGGVIGSSLFDAIQDLDEGPDLVHRFTDIFVWDFDFSRESRTGDEFRLVFEKRYDTDGFLEYGDILAASYRNEQRELLAFYFEDEDGYGDYYAPDGTALRRTFLRAPVKYRRISSRYSKRRLHPILKRVRPHEGIDYAAPKGTPVWSVAKGTVIYRGWNGGFGKLIKIRHNNGYVSFYGHLSRYGKGLKVGSKVDQKQVVGYVGSTGLSTGPHLDYRLKIGGRFVDPLKVRLPKGTSVAVTERERFDAVRELRLAELGREGSYSEGFRTGM